MSNFATNWQTPVDNARGAYNNSGIPGGQHTVYITNYAPSALDDVRITVTNQIWCYSDIAICVNTENARGITHWFDEVLHECTNNGDCDSLHSRPNTWWYAFPTLDNDTHNNYPYNNSFQRQAVAAHEYGHAIGIAHNGLFDNACINSSSLRKTIMDPDCILRWNGYQYVEELNIPQAWDSCGINHKYYDPNWGYAGC